MLKMSIQSIIRVIRRRRLMRRRKQKQFRRITTNIHVGREECFTKYRFYPETILYLIHLLSPYLKHPSKKSMAISPGLQILVALRFFATGSFYRLVGDSFGLSVASVARCVDRVTSALCRISKDYIKFPTGEQVAAVKRGFYNIAGFPNVLGAVDGSLIPIQSPTDDEDDFLCRKGFHALNVQMTCDHNFKITNCVANWPGSVHDQRIFNNSHLCSNFENGLHNNSFLLGDSGYTCRPFLLTPYLVCDSPSKLNFNKALSKTRSMIERTFGILKRRFSCLKSVLRLQPHKAAKVIVACAVLHNIGIERGEIINYEEIEHEEDDTPEINNIHRDRQAGDSIRDYIRNTYFSQ